MRIRALAVPAVILFAGTTLVACGDTEPAASTSPSETMMEDDSMSPSPHASDSMMEDDEMMEDEG